MRPYVAWHLRSRVLHLGARTHVMGIVNVTPDSFSDGGAHTYTDAAVDHAMRLLDHGADLLDIGGESTRPGSPAGTSQAIAAADEQRRVLPVIEELLRRRPDAIVSVDTYRASTARMAVAAGAEIVNDVSGLLWDQAMPQTVAELRCGLVVMHARGLPSEWSRLPPLQANQLIPTVQSELAERLSRAVAAGIEAANIAIDPGFGFGKQGVENWALLARLSAIGVPRHPLLVGLSRKGFLAPSQPAADRDPQTHAANTIAVLQGVHVVRVHDVAGARRAADVADAALAASS